jgi:hypothetical protein
MTRVVEAPEGTTNGSGMPCAPQPFLSGKLVLGFGSICEAHQHHSTGFPFPNIARRFSLANIDARFENCQQFSPATVAHQDTVRLVSSQGCNVFVNSASFIMPPRRDNATKKGLLGSFVGWAVPTEFRAACQLP